VKIEGSIGRGSAVDWIPIIEGYSLNNWAWWNSSWSYCRDLNVSVGVADTDFVYSKNITGIHNIDSIRILDAPCGCSGSETPHWIRLNSSTWAEVHWASDGTASTNYSIYYNNSAASSKSDGTATFPFFDATELRADGDDATDGIWEGYKNEDTVTYKNYSDADSFTGDISLRLHAHGVWFYANNPETGDFILETDIWINGTGTDTGMGCLWLIDNSDTVQASLHSGYNIDFWQIYDTDGYDASDTATTDGWHKMKMICFADETGRVFIDDSELNVDIDSLCTDERIAIRNYGYGDFYFDNTRVREYYSVVDPTVAIGDEVIVVNISITLGNVTETIYEESNLNPNITATSTKNFEVYLYLENINGSEYKIFNVSEAAGTYTNSSIKIDTTNYLDALYYLHAIANATLSDSDDSANFTIRNLHIWDLGNITCNGNLSGNEYFNLSFYSAENSTAEVTLSNAALSWSLYNLTYVGGGNYTNNALLLNTNDYNSSTDYYLTVSVTDNIGNVESNSTCNFSIDNDVPAVTFDWLISNGWYSSLNHSVNFSVSDTMSPSISCNITYNAVDHSDVYTNGTINTLFANLVNGINWFNYTCNDTAGNSMSASESITAAYSQINIKKEEERGTDFPIENYTAYMFVSLASADNITYEETNSSKMKNWYFYVLNDTIKEIHLAIATDYYRSQTDLQTLTNVTFYMYNNTEFSSSQILFQIDTVGYEEPLIIKRPRTDTEDIITAEYPIGANREVNAYLLDSRLYNLYGYDADGKEQFISALMVSGSRIINIEIPTSYESFISTQSIYAHFTSAQIGDTDNYTLTASAKGTTYTIAIKNWSGSTLDSGIYAGRVL